MCEGPLPFFNWIVSLPGVEWCKFFIYFGNQIFVEVSFANIFSQAVGSLFIVLMFSVAEQKLFILMKSHLFILSFMWLALGDILVKILLHKICEVFLSLIPSRTFMLS